MGKTVVYRVCLANAGKLLYTVGTWQVCGSCCIQWVLRECRANKGAMVCAQRAMQSRWFREMGPESGLLMSLLSHRPKEAAQATWGSKAVV